ncbi:DUF4280 domain-containing protein [Aquimarina sp. BL5]|uniref:DUF4280 domain-containing protein n=1 Tax=Aquimarina sp. BL5 TaxID=1714860 RepID=UPI000E550FAA|nr:DUF4280 domain-containing protein [Aquimarina sp. BL5]AXT50282.1 DUF4280 domain-containing protein [Aquimarina sp. BL5]RKN07148.1 DUF4280 domain-containing protein [Aquimarina sp. BL5]
MAGQFVKNGATLKCPLCSSSGTLVVSHTQVQLQDTPCATNGDKSKSNLVFGGVCKKWRKSPPPCASVIAPTQWKGVATDVEIDGEFMLLEDSTITCSTGGVDIGIDDTAQMDVPTDLPDTENTVLKKFLVNVRRPDDYKGEYGFDWLRDEYIYPIETIGYDNTGSPFSGPLNQQLPLCKNVDDLKNEYKTKDVVNPITPYGVEYYPAWLSIFPDVSYNGVNQVELNIEIEEIEPLVGDATEIIFESANDSLIVTPSQISLSELLGEKQTKDLGVTTKEFYVTEKMITVKCEGNALENHEEIKIYAELDGEKEEVGKLMVYNNSAIANANVIAVNVIIDGNPAILNSNYKTAIKYESTVQPLIHTEVIDDGFDIDSLPDTDPDVKKFKDDFITKNLDIGPQFDSVNGFLNDLVRLYDKYGHYKPVTGIEEFGHNKTFLFYTNVTGILERQDLPPIQWRGLASADQTDISNVKWGNACIIFGGGLSEIHNVPHEIGHSFSLPHSFEEEFNTPFFFYRGFTDNYMDYPTQFEPDLNKEPLDNRFRGNMHSFFKWQWDVIREDKSLAYDNTDIE